MAPTAFFSEEGTGKIYTYLMESVLPSSPPLAEIDPRVTQLVNELIGRVADKWTMLILEVLAEHGELRFTRVGELVGGISQKMLTQTLRLMERDGLVIRTVHPVIPPKVEYRLTDLGVTLAEAFCGVWTWAETNIDRIEAARALFETHRRDLGYGLLLKRHVADPRMASDRAEMPFDGKRMVVGGFETIFQA